MKKRNNWVIDADIARSAGETNHPFSKNCRFFLNQIQLLKRKVIFNNKLESEWNKHRSLYAKKWLASMIARRLVDYCEPTMSLINVIKKSSISSKEISVATKDIHLIELAFVSDKAIASGDNKAKLIFVKIAVDNPNLTDIVWINPKSDGEKVITLLNTKVSYNSPYYLRNN